MNELRSKDSALSYHIWRKLGFCSNEYGSYYLNPNQQSSWSTNTEITLTFHWTDWGQYNILIYDLCRMRSVAHSVCRGKAQPPTWLKCLNGWNEFRIQSNNKTNVTNLTQNILILQGIGNKILICWSYFVTILERCHW